jgi:hypothetical protein
MLIFWKRCEVEEGAAEQKKKKNKENGDRRGVPREPPWSTAVFAFFTICAERGEEEDQRVLE